MLNPATFRLSSSVWPSTSRSPFASISPLNVETPETVRVVDVAPTPWNSAPPAKVESPMNVETPDTLRSVNVFGAFAIALSMVDVVVASREAMFCSSLPELIT